jgi:3-isopropylmalate/(R)-2-methylmalate dehydratase small subunit
VEKFTRIDAPALPLATPNVDTDQIIPARFLWHPRSDGYGQWLFNDLRFAEDGTEKPGFILNQPRYATAKVLVGERNFGCGSSREHAVWALYDHGFRVVIAPSFGDIFYNNSFKQGLLPVILPETEIAALREAIERGNSTQVSVDLETQTVTGPGGFSARFEIAPFRKKKLLDGLDDIAMTLGLSEEIGAFEAEFDLAMPWLVVEGA